MYVGPELLKLDELASYLVSFWRLLKSSLRFIRSMAVAPLPPCAAEPKETAAAAAATAEEKSAMLAAADSAAAEPAVPLRREVSELVAEVSALEVGEEEEPYLREETVLPPLEVVTIGWPLASSPRDLFLLAIGQPDALEGEED